MVPWIYHAPWGWKKIGIKRSRDIFGKKLRIINDRLLIIYSVSKHTLKLLIVFHIWYKNTSTIRIYKKNLFFSFQISSWIHAHENKSIWGLLHSWSVQQTFWNRSKDDSILPTKQFANSWSRTHPPSHPIRRRIIVMSFSSLMKRKNKIFIQVVSVWQFFTYFVVILQLRFYSITTKSTQS